MKQNKTLSFDYDVVDYLRAIPNASNYVQDLIYVDMKRLKELKNTNKAPSDLSNIHEAAINEETEQTKKKEEQANRNKAWELLDLDVREEIKSIESWGVKWREVFYPLYVQKGSLTVKDVRDWWFNEQSKQ